MQIPDSIEIKVNGKTTAYLSPQADGLKDCYVDCRLNGESTLEFSLPSTSEKINELTPECEIWAGGRVYNLLKDDAVDTVRDENNKRWTTFMAVERWNELNFSYIEPYLSNDPTTPEPADLAVIIVGGGNDLSNGQYTVGTAAHALYAILQGSDWSLGTCDVDGIYDLEAEKVSRLELIKMVQETWGGYLLFDSVNKIVHLRDADKWQPYNGFQIRYKKNLKYITRTQSNNIITKLYPFGHDDLDIAAVNDGKKYITNFSYTSREYIGIYKNQDIYDQQELLEKAQAELELMCRPRYLYTVKMVDLRTLPGYSHEDFTLGDMVDIIDPDVAPNGPMARIIRHKYNIFQPWDCELEIGDPEERLIEQLKATFDTANFIDGKFNGSGEFSGYSIEGSTITGEHIKAGSIEIGHLSSGFVAGLNLLDNPIFVSYAEQVSSLNGIVSEHATLIQQNADTISLQATEINNLGQSISNLSVRADEIEGTVSDNREYYESEITRIDGNISTINTTISDQWSQITQRADEIELSVSNLTETVETNYNELNNSISSVSETVSQHWSSINQRADGIESTVSELSTTVTTNYNELTGKIESVNTEIEQAQSQITQLADEISLKVTIGDVVNYLSINRDGVQIAAENIDLTGITRIYSPNDNDDFLQMTAGGITITAFGGNEQFHIHHDGIVGWKIRTDGEPLYFPDTNWVHFEGGVDFSGADVYGLKIRFA